MNPVLSPELEKARAAGRPIVVCESSVFAQGLPHPSNLEAARRIHAAIESTGCVPAVAAVVGGLLRVGLNEQEIARFAVGDSEKVGARDLAEALRTGKDGALTVSGTLVASALVGAPVMVTGGVGGVHRGWAQTLDVSSDLYELARNPVAVISSGVKSVLDVGATLEVLESLSVPVVGVGTAVMPGFLVRETGFSLEAQAADADECVALLRLHWDVLRRPGGVLFCNPVPAEFALPADIVEEAVDRALGQTEAAGVLGKEVTPFLLRRIDNLTSGKSLVANVALLEANAKLAGSIAASLMGREEQP